MEETYDKEFYAVVWEETPAELKHTFVHLRNGETLADYMWRVHKVSLENVNQIYKRTYVKR